VLSLQSVGEILVLAYFAKAAKEQKAPFLVARKVKAPSLE
jgi:hypothetical protein